MIQTTSPADATSSTNAFAARLDGLADLMSDSASTLHDLAGQVERGDCTILYAAERVRFLAAALLVESAVDAVAHG